MNWVKNTWLRVEGRLVRDWHTALHWWSVRWAAIGAVVLPALNVIPQQCPPEVQALFPDSVKAAITGGWCIVYIALRVWAQKQP